MTRFWREVTPWNEMQGSEEVVLVQVVSLFATSDVDLKESRGWRSGWSYAWRMLKWKRRVSLKMRKRNCGEPNSTLFFIKLHYGGVFIISPNRKYNNGCDLDNGLEPLACDNDVVLLGNYVTQGLKLVEVFVEHEKTNPDIYTPSKAKRLVIKELDDAKARISKAEITPVAKKLVLDVNNKQTSGKILEGQSSGKILEGQSSGKDLEGQSSGKDLKGKSSAIGNNGSSQVPSQFVNDFYSLYDPYEESQDPNFDPFVDLDLILPTDRNRECNTSENVDLVDTTHNVEIKGKEERQGEEETYVEDEINSKDSDYLVDEDNNVDDVDVNMEGFEYNIDEDVEFVGCRDKEQEPGIEEGDAVEIEVLDNDYFESAYDSDDEANRLRKRKLKQIRKQAHASEQIYKTYFYMGKEFPNKEEVKAYIKEHSIETVREIRLEKNDNERVRAICRGFIPSLPTFEDLDNGPSQGNGLSQGSEPSQASGSKEKWTKEKIAMARSPTGFKARMRDLLGLDGAFMKGPYPGQLLIAVSVDPNNCIYPLAYGLVKTENTESWTWFLTRLGDDLDLYRNSNFTFVSERQKGIIPAIASLFLNAEHRYCVKHIHENMKKKWNVRTKSDVLLNKMFEVFNGKLVAGRDRPIIATFEFAREYLMKRIVNVNKLIDRCDGPLIPTATKILRSNSNEARKYTVDYAGDDLYKVSGPWNDQVVVNVLARTCTCRRWELTGIPCKHAVTTNWVMSLNNEAGIPEEWVHPCYRLDTWKKVYYFKIKPIRGRIHWPKCNVPTTLLPPKHQPQVGRPSKERKKLAAERDVLKIVKNGKLSRKHKTVTCNKCNIKVHN
nr:hypothetical protein [Tanacetum cinerariifolium]